MTNLTATRNWIAGSNDFDFNSAENYGYSYVGNSPVNYTDPTGLVHCPPTQKEIDDGEAIPVGDLDGDGKTDYKFPNELGNGYGSFCFSSGGSDFYITAPDGSYVHRCPYVAGENQWHINNLGSTSSVRDPNTGEKITYKYFRELDELKIKVYSKNGICMRSQVIHPAPKKPDNLPWPDNVTPIESPQRPR
ncbi:MAG TPA: hypothetical protein VFE46_11380 [Pirellulales bacterium]|jgi:hypothetical protein|nr:hypothetical protein [Pirellulales bacterium]